MAWQKKLEISNFGLKGLFRRRLGKSANVANAVGVSAFVARPVLWPELVAQWQLTPELSNWMDLREGSRCSWCNCNLRSSQLAVAIVRVVGRLAGGNPGSLKDAFAAPAARKLRIAEVNRAGTLHGALKHCEGLSYSEYGSVVDGLPSEDLMALSYADSSLDMVITSDTLEHVPDVDLALREIWRVLKAGGAHVFTVPLLMERSTRRRAELRDGAVTNLMEPSFHGSAYAGGDDLLVFHEFGGDFIARCEDAGFDVEILRDPINPLNISLIASKRVPSVSKS